MATYALTVSTNALGLGVINGATVRIEKRRIAIADTYPPINNLIQISQATNSSGIATFLLEPDDLTTYHVAKIFDTAGIFIYERFFSMPPSATSLDNTATGVLFGNSNIQFKDEGNNRGTPSSVRNVDFVGAGVEATFEGDTLRVFVQAGSQGFVAITDIAPTNPSDNVGTKVKTDDNNVLQSCISSTTAITVSVLAVTGSTFKPTVDVNGTQAVLTRNAGTDVWQGTAAITLTGASPYTVTATHGQGAVDTATVTIEAAPVISSLVFDNEYSQGVGQTEHAANQTLDLVISSATPFVALEVIDDSSTATLAYTETFAATTNKTIQVTVANRGNTPTAYPAKVRIRNANGTWSAVTATSNTIILNNSQPVITFNSISYPASQQAIKSGDPATTVNVTETNVDTVSYTSTELTVANPTTMGNKTVTYLSGGYNISTDNLTVVATKTSNATTATFSTVVWIANTAPTITVTTPAARLRSGVTPQNHTISINSNQRTLATPTLNASVGTFSGSWVTANNGLTWTRSLAIADSDTKGSANFSGLSITNLAGIEVTAISSGDSYTVGGFTQRTLIFPLWDANQIREVAIGTDVVDVTKLVAFNVTRNRATTYRATVGDEIDKFTIINGNTLYNCDLENASTALTSPVLITIEETVA